MKKIIGTVIIVFSCIGLMAQFTVRLVVNSVATKKQDDIFVTGSFNKWNPGDINYKLKPFGPTRKAIVLKDIPAGKLEFKFTRGSYDKVETTASGNDIENRSADVQADISIDITIPGWRDDYPDKPKPNTATAQELFNSCSAHGGKAWDHSAMVKALEKLANFEIGQKP